jgi:uncharacterized membrane protein YqjE
MDALGSPPRIILEGLLHRGELAGIELRDARSHLAITGAAAGGAGALVLLGGLTGTFALAALVWERGDRAVILGLVALGYVLVAGALGWWTAARVRSWRPLPETRYQLREDCACLNHYLSTKDG